MAIKKITIRDVAREAGVSVTLVSFVMNAKMGKDGRLDCPVNPVTAARVLEVAKRLGYRKNNAAASLRSGRSHTIAFIISDIASPFFSEICRYMENVAYAAGYTVLFASSDENAEKLDRLIDTVIGYNIEGMIVAPCAGSEPVLDKALSYNIPIVLIDRNIEGEQYGRVMVDNVDSGYQAAKCLIDRGDKKVEMISYSLEVTSLRDREEGYKKAMQEAGLANNIQVHKIDYETSESSAQVLEIIKSAKERGVESFILPTKRLAMYGFEAMAELKIKYLSGDKFPFVGYDESDIYNLNRPPIPHMVQPMEEIAEQSFNLLQSMISETEVSDKNIVLKAKLVYGGSYRKKTALSSH